MIGIGISIGASVITAAARPGTALQARFPGAVAALDFGRGQRMGPSSVAVSRAGPAYGVTGLNSAAGTLLGAAPDTPRQDAGGLLIEPAGTNLVPAPAMQGASMGTETSGRATGAYSRYLPTHASVAFINAVAGSVSYTVHDIATRRGMVMMDLEMEAGYAGSGPNLLMDLRVSDPNDAPVAPGQAVAASIFVELTDSAGVIDYVGLQNLYYDAAERFASVANGPNLAGRIARGALSHPQLTDVAPSGVDYARPQVRFSCHGGAARTVRRRFWIGAPQLEFAGAPSSPMPGGSRSAETARLTGLGGDVYDIYVTDGADAVAVHPSVTAPSGDWPIPAPGPAGRHRVREIVVMPAGAADPYA